MSTDQYAGEFAERWDELVDWERRTAVEADFLDRVVTAAAPGRALLDIACGTGFHTAYFHRAGFQVHACDGSADMVLAARRNLHVLDLGMRVHQMHWDDLQPQATEKYDVVICLGSSIPHADREQRHSLLRRVHQMLTPGGFLVVDHRNFDHIVARQEMPPGRSVYGGAVEVSLVGSDRETTTFGYRYADGYFRTLIVASVGFDELRGELAATGFGRIDSFGDQHRVDAADDSGFFTHRAVRTAPVSAETVG